MGDSSFGQLVEPVTAGALSVRDQAPAMLAYVGSQTDAGVLRECKAQAAAVVEYLARRREESVEDHNAALKIRMRVEHRLGEVLAETVRHQGGRPEGNGDAVSPFQLPDEVTRKQSSRAQQLASLPWEELEAAVDAQTEKGARASQVRTVEIVREKQREQSPSAEVSAPGVPHWEIREGDCLALLPDVPDGTARLVFCDPPYNLGIDYGEGCEADLLPAAEYMAWAARWIAEAHRVLAADGSLWVLVSDEYAPEYGVAIKQAGFTVRNIVKWYETFGVNCTDKFSRTSRLLYYAVKDARSFVFDRSAVMRPSDRQTKYDDPRANPAGKVLDDVWTDIPRLAGTHAERLPGFPTQLPLALLRRVVLCASRPGDVVMDFFSGSGTTGAAAVEGGRQYLGLERQPTFARAARARLWEVPHAARD